eukprot:Clim_evm20s6 gene=Clim_evmTU20s6
MGFPFYSVDELKEPKIYLKVAEASLAVFCLILAVASGTWSKLDEYGSTGDGAFFVTWQVLSVLAAMAALYLYDTPKAGTDEFTRMDVYFEAVWAFITLVGHSVWADAVYDMPHDGAAVTSTVFGYFAIFAWIANIYVCFQETPWFTYQRATDSHTHYLNVDDMQSAHGPEDDDDLHQFT